MVDQERIRALTGKQRVKQQITWLRENGYYFHVNRKGPVIVLSDGKPLKYEYPEPPKGLLRQDEIIKLATPVQPICGVYFLISGSRIFYVGQSIRILERINEHVRKGVQFDAFYFIKVPKSKLLATEAAYIKAFRPPGNRVGK